MITDDETTNTPPPADEPAAEPVVNTEPKPTVAAAGEGATDTIGGNHPGEDAEHITVAGDPTGEVSNRVGGTLQREPTPEELPADARVTPIAEQVNPSAAQAVGAAPQPESIAGAEQPKEGEKNVVPDTGDGSQFLSETSDQHDDAERAVEEAGRDADRGRY